jgi:hypothetical protein
MPVGADLCLLDSYYSSLFVSVFKMRLENNRSGNIDIIDAPQVIIDKGLIDIETFW